MKSIANNKITVLISENNEVYLTGLVFIVNKFPKVQEICSAKNPKEIKALNKNLFFDLFLIDIDMLDFDPEYFIKIIRKKIRKQRLF